jgi:hypothetical protein
VIGPALGELPITKRWFADLKQPPRPLRFQNCFVTVRSIDRPL